MFSKRNAFAAVILLSSLNLSAGIYRLTGPVVEYLKELGYNYSNNHCDFDQPDTLRINNQEISSIEIIGDSVKLLGNGSVAFTHEGDLLFNYFADEIKEILDTKDPEKNNGIISCEEELISYPSPLLRYHTITTCIVKGSLQKIN